MADNFILLAIELLHEFEGGPNGRHAAYPYICPAGKQTIGWGHALRPGEWFQTPMSEMDADDLLRKDTIATWKAISWYIAAPVTASMKAALISFAFNLGPGALMASTLLIKLNRRDYQGASDEFPRWNKARDPKTGKMIALAGLTRRRKAERKLFLHDGVPDAS